MFFLRIWENLGFMSPPNLAIPEIGFSCQFSFAAPARWEAKGLPDNGVHDWYVGVSEAIA